MQWWWLDGFPLCYFWSMIPKISISRWAAWYGGRWLPLLWNYLIAPIYMGYPREAVAELLVPAFLPFNLLKAGLNAGFTFLLYKPIITALRKAGYISDSQNVQGRKPIGLWLFSGILVITCILLILSFNGIIWGAAMGQISKRKPLHILSGNVIHGRGKLNLDKHTNGMII